MPVTWMIAAAAAAVQLPADPDRTTWEDVAAAGAPTDVRGIPTWRDGAFRVGDRRGQVTRRVSSARDDDGLTVRDYAEGRYRFTLTGGAQDDLAGECAFGRTAASVPLGSGWSIDAPGEPLLLHCTFTRGGGAVGDMVLRGRIGARGVLPLERRIGEVRMGDTRLTLASLHAFGKRRWPSGDAVGYAFRDETGALVGGAAAADFGKRRLSLPTTPAQRDAALAAGVAIALFWDPGEEVD